MDSPPETDSAGNQWLNRVENIKIEEFSFYVGDKVSKDTREVLILWSPGFYNHRCVIYGAMKKENISRLQMGNISVDFFNTSITPAPEKEYKVAKELLKVADL